MTKPIITVVGSFAVGMTIRTSRMPIFGETLVGADFDMGPGGKGSNQAVGAARLGAEAYLAGIVGQDKLADIAIELYAREGVNTRYLKQTAEKATGVGFIILNPAGQNGIILDMAANELLDARFVDDIETQIAQSAMVMAVLEIPVVAAARAMELARKHGVRCLLNPAPATRLDAEVIRNLDFITPNETELRILLGLAPDDATPTPTLAERLLAVGAQNVIVTMGEQGALVLNRAGMTHVPAVPVQVIDTTGAGDAFNAALAVALAEGRELADAVKWANCAGALECTRLGVIPGLPQRESVAELYKQRYS
ncbi:MAG: ribokinase [Anaerolineae bacterium]|nr:ribokinase [Anaerolineae bacterium]